jgi:hypothetical protein
LIRHWASYFRCATIFARAERHSDTRRRWRYASWQLSAGYARALFTLSPPPFLCFISIDI